MWKWWNEVGLANTDPTLSSASSKTAPSGRFKRKREKPVLKVHRLPSVLGFLPSKGCLKVSSVL